MCLTFSIKCQPSAIHTVSVFMHSQQVDRTLGKNERLRSDMFGELLQAANNTGDLRSCPVCDVMPFVHFNDDFFLTKWWLNTFPCPFSKTSVLIQPADSLQATNRSAEQLACYCKMGTKTILGTMQSTLRAFCCDIALEASGRRWCQTSVRI